MIKTTHTLLLLIAIVYILVMTKTLLVPFVVALLIWYLVKNIRNFMARSDFFRRRLPLWLQNTLVFLLLFGILRMITQLLTGSIESFVAAIPVYEAGVENLNFELLDRYGLNFSDYLQDFIGSFEISQWIEPVVNSISQLLSSSFMIVLYVIFLLLEESTFSKKHRLLFKDERRYAQTMELVQQIDITFGNYISIKTLTSLITAILSFTVLTILGVDTPLLWAGIIFLLNYIPSIGSLIATTFPAIIAILQNGDLWAGLWVLIGVGAIQVIVGNLLEPRLMGNSMNISPLVVILSLVAWGAIWGVLGMILSVPIMVMVIIVCARFEATRQIAVLLSENGNVG